MTIEEKKATVRSGSVLAWEISGRKNFLSPKNKREEIDEKKKID
jgi:hypothetical protein